MVPCQKQLKCRYKVITSINFKSWILTMKIASFLPTPEGFIIRTPSPKVATPPPASALLCYIPTPANVGFSPIDCLPFYQFSSLFSQEGMLNP
jgi:hypothetical protein